MFGNKNGFTLMELLVVAFLLAVISFTTYSGLSVGVRIWKRIESSVQEVDLALGWKKFRKDIAGHIPFSPIGFIGTPEVVSFPGLVTVNGEGGPHEEVGKIRYLFDAGGHHLCREEMTYAEAVGEGSAACRPVISSVTKVSFKYFGMEEEGGVASWRSAWGEEIAPLAVRLELALKTGEKEGEIEKQFTATLP